MNRLTQHLAQAYDRQRILILGWGREGQSSYEVLKASCPNADIFCSDQNTDLLIDVQTTPYLQNLEQFDVIFKTPAIPVRTPELQTYLSLGKKITSQLNEFLAVYRSQTVGITGTKGKSTTSSLVAHLLREIGKDTIFAGNIGTPVFSIVDQVQDEMTLVIEMSSYQLETTTSSPHVAILLNLFPEHLNYHQGIENYVQAKSHITLHQNNNDIFVFNQDIPVVAQVATQTVAQKYPFSYASPLQYPDRVHAVLTQLEGVSLPATVKTRNVLPAVLAIQHLEWRPEQVLTALSTFTPLPHRLETVSTSHQMTWIDDTLATIPEATIAALEALPRVDVLLLGGYDRGIDFAPVVEAVMKKKVPYIGFFQPSGQKMYDLIQQRYSPDEQPVMKLVNDMEDAVRFAYEHTSVNGVVLLSPSSPSFGQFKDYRDKSQQFRSWIERLA
jgi:UDP-N-acetylmuramoyl-L-alanine---L-glutamate ligase